MINKEYVDKEIFRLIKVWTDTLYLIIIPILLAMSSLDYFAHRDHFLEFLIYRILAAALFLIGYVVNQRIKTLKGLYIIQVFETIVVSTMIESMIMATGRHSDGYYAGFIITLIYGVLMMPIFSIKVAVMDTLIVCSIYIIPILLFDTITHPDIFIENIIFLSSVAVACLIARHLKNKDTNTRLVYEFDLNKKKTEAEINFIETDNKLRNIIDNVNIGVFRNVQEGGGRFLQANAALAKMFHYESVEDLINNAKPIDLYDDEKDRNKLYDKLQDEGFVRDYIIRLQTKDGGKIIGSFTAAAFYGDNGRIKWIDGVVEDITEKQKYTEALEKSERKYRELYENSTEGIVIIDKNGVIFDVNRKFSELHMSNKSELIGTKIGLINLNNDQDNYDEMLQRINNGESVSFRKEHYRTDGERVLFDVSAVALRLNGEIYIQKFYRDITEKEKMQKHLLNTQKMDSVGIFAGGIAHNFNNILTYILGGIEFLQLYDNLDATARQKLASMETSARKASTLVNSLLGFARTDEAHTFYPMKFAHVLNDALNLCESLLGNKVKVILQDPTDNIDTIHGDPSQLEHVIINLLVNARDAMPDGGIITIETNTIEATDQVHIPSYIKNGKYLVLKIIDTGVGIPQGNIDRIFEPFYTTKVRGKGTGLGLSTVYTIIKDHGGYITVESILNKGTTFNVYLPLADFGLIEDNKQNSPEDDKSTQFQILVVDDDEEVKSMVADLLTLNGYSAIAMTNPIEALSYFRTNAENISLVVTDIEMNYMNGIELIKNLKKIKRDLKVIAISAYTKEKVESVEMIDMFIHKPFSGKLMVAAIGKLIGNTVTDDNAEGFYARA